MKNMRLLLFVFLLLLVPSAAFADGGGPLLLFFNFLAFLYGSIFIVIIEWLMYCWLAGVTKKDGFVDSVVANALSTVVIWFGFPFGLGLVTALASFVPWGVGDFMMAIGTWVYERMQYPKLSLSMTGFWLFVTFFLTVRYEGKILRKRWGKRAFEGKITSVKLSWYCNSVTYAGLFIFFFGAWVYERNSI